MNDAAGDDNVVLERTKKVISIGEEHGTSILCDEHWGLNKMLTGKDIGSFLFELLV